MCDLSYVTPKLKLQSSLSACQLINKKILDTSYHLVVLVSYFTRGGSKYTTSYSRVVLLASSGFGSMPACVHADDDSLVQLFHLERSSACFHQWAH